jgi:hypothetical protein
MDSRPVSNKLATNSLTLGILGWIIYLIQWCFDLTIGLLLAVVSAGMSTICATALDLLPFVLWLIGILSGHAALAQIKRTGSPGRGRAVWGLALGYLGMFFTILLIVVIVSLIASGIGVGVLDKIIPMFTRH